MTPTRQPHPTGHVQKARSSTHLIHQRVLAPCPQFQSRTNGRIPGYSTCWCRENLQLLPVLSGINVSNVPSFQPKKDVCLPNFCEPLNPSCEKLYLSTE